MRSLLRGGPWIHVYTSVFHCIVDTGKHTHLVAATAIGDWLVIDRPPATVLHAAGPWRIHLQPAIIDGGGVSGRGVAWVTTRPSSAVDRRLLEYT